jgi:hypothetical protein
LCYDHLAASGKHLWRVPLRCEPIRGIGMVEVFTASRGALRGSDERTETVSPWRRVRPAAQHSEDLGAATAAHGGRVAIVGVSG